MSRHINLSKAQWNSLPSDEREVFELFDKKLLPEWEMYIKPHLNGLNPDVVLVNPKAGIAVFNIIKSDQIIGNPLEKIQFYKEEILRLYCTSLKEHFGNNGAGAIIAGLVFTRVPQASLDSYYLFSNRSYPKYYPIAGSDSLVAGDLNKLFPEWSQWGKHNPSSLMSESTGDDLRKWLGEPDYSQIPQNPLRLNTRQRAIAETRTETFYRRVKGAAGSGKTQALAARAAVLASEGKRVLVCLFNITLRYYPRDLAWQHATSLPWNSGLKIDFLHFHDWCKRVCFISGRGDDYKPLSNTLRVASSTEEEKELILHERLPILVQQIYDETVQARSIAELEQNYTNSSTNDAPPRYDSILVDEGQDFTLRWWKTLEKALMPDGEMLFVADTTQNVYGRDFNWLKEEIRTGGFRGPWFELGPSYRLPSRLITILQRFADEFLDEDVDIPRPAQEELNLDLQLRWIQVSSRIPIDDCAEEVGNICFKEVQDLRKNSSILDSDITFLAHTHKIGRVFVRRCENANPEVPVHHIFGIDEHDKRNKKLDFRPEDPRMKATTLHSFKGLESRHLIIHISSITREDDPALFYTALTRLKKHDHGSCCLTVVSSCRELENFGSEWEDFERILL
jgi:hypothetical protein